MRVFAFISLFFILAEYGYGQTNPFSKPEHDPPVIPNKYTEVVAFNICTNELAVNQPAYFMPGDTVLMIQMKGAIVDTGNSSSFGTVISYGNAGNYEFNYVAQVNGNRVKLLNRLMKTYDIPDGIVQLIRVPYYDRGYFSGGLTCDPWDGTKGGVLAVIARNSIRSEEPIFVSGWGFTGGLGSNASYMASLCDQNAFRYPDNSSLGANKGESIASLSTNISRGKGNFAAAGGGGNSHNAGGGGGGNAGMGGFGGFQSDSCSATALDNRGIGGKGLMYSPSANKVFMGGGGGAGHHHGGGSLIPYGGSGAGIIIIKTDTLWIGEKLIEANGTDAFYCSSGNCTDGMPGGGAGGTVLLDVRYIEDSLVVETRGGNGGSVIDPVSVSGRPGPGGGGGGGVFYYNGNSWPVNYRYAAGGGQNGVISTDANNAWGATPGNAGTSHLNMVLPFTNILFKPNIDSVRIKDSLVYCNRLSFTGQCYTNTYPNAAWFWDFGDGSFANTQTAVHDFPAIGNYLVKLVTTDVNGCMDSITRLVNTSGNMLAEAGPDQLVCLAGTAMVNLFGNGTGNTYAWSPAALLNNPNISNPVATISGNTTFYVQVTNNAGCLATDSVKITTTPFPVTGISKSNDVTCSQPSAQLLATGGQFYAWSPSNSLNNAQIANPLASPKQTTKYQVAVTNAAGCTATDTITVIARRIGGLELPNSFTPNGDGLNDCFGIRYPGGVTELQFIIYNYLGQKVFETRDPTQCWNGLYRGKKADMRNYVYYLKANTNCGPVELTGNILLIR